MPIPQYLICGNLFAIPRALLQFFLRVSGRWLCNHNSMETISVIPSRRILVAAGLGLPLQSEASRDSKAFLKPHSLPHFGPRGFPLFPFRHRAAASQHKLKCSLPRHPRFLKMLASHLLLGPFFWIILTCLSRRSSAGLTEPELLLSIACHADVLSLISHRERAIMGNGLQ